MSGGEHPNTLMAMQNLAGAYHAQGKYADAAALGAQTLEMRKRVLGAEHRDTLQSMNNLVVACHNLRKYAEAVALNAETLAIRQRVLGAEHPDTFQSLSNLALAYVQMRDLPKAESVYRELLASRLRKEGADSLNAAATRASLGTNLLKQQRFADAELVLRESQAVREKKEPDNWQTFNTRSLLGGALVELKKSAEAEPLLVSGYEGMKQREAKIPAANKVRLKEALERLVRLYTDWRQPEKAAAWEQKLDQHNQAEAQKKSAGEPKTK